MLTTGQIIKIFSNSKGKSKAPQTENIVKMMQYTDILPQMGGNGIDYHYRINILDLSKSGIPDEAIFEMVDDGWILSKDRKFIEYIF